MTRIALRTLAFATLFASSIASAYLSGPVGTACSGTTTAGTVYSGTQGWSVDPATGNGYWSCCTPGTSCVGRDKPAKFNTLADPRDLRDSTHTPTRAPRPHAEPMPAQPERRDPALRERNN